MLHRIFQASILAFLCATLLTGCGPSTPLSPDQKIAEKQVVALIPKGMPEATAKRLLTERGFTLSQMPAAPGTNRLLVASYHSHDRSWLVGLVVVNARVMGASVTISELPHPAK